MSSILLPPAQAAFTAVNSSIPLATAATGAASGYGGAIATVITNLAVATTSITTILTAITPAGPMGPPSLLTIPNCNNALAQLTTINASIAAATTASVIIAGLPDPATFPPAATLVVTQITALAPFINVAFVVPQL